MVVRIGLQQQTLNTQLPQRLVLIGQLSQMVSEMLSQIRQLQLSLSLISCASLNLITTSVRMIILEVSLIWLLSENHRQHRTHLFSRASQMKLTSFIIVFLTVLFLQLLCMAELLYSLAIIMAVDVAAELHKGGSYGRVYL